MRVGKALFLDRDGVINIDYGYVYKKQNFVFIPEIFRLVNVACSLGYRVIVVTNQGGIGLGYYSVEDFLKLSDWMKTEFEKRNGRIDEIYFEPSHPRGLIGGGLGDTAFRKPNPGMFFQAKQDYELEMKNCLMVGDNLTDIEAAVRAGVPTRFLIKPEISTSEPTPTEYTIIKSLDKVTRYLENINDN